jgi:glyceraldehyde 3-phosphate dehydrogenase
MSKIRVAINGFGRIGRAFVRASRGVDEIELVAVNDLADVRNLAYLLKYDTAYKKAPFEVSVKEDGSAFLIDGREVKYFAEKDGTKLPWRDLAIDVVIESTGHFTSYEKSRFHLDAGAKRVVISAPSKDASATILLGINEDSLSGCAITSNASCTTNGAAPFLAIIHEKIGIAKALLNTVHGYTASQSLVDAPNKKDWREGRAAAMNIVPSSTGAAKAVTEVITDLKGKFDGVSMRIPIVTGSIVDVTFLTKRPTTKEEINDILKTAAGEERWKKTFGVTEEELVSSDIIGETRASVADLKFTRVVDGDLVKVMAWYDNEMGYTYSLLEHVIKAGRYTK